MRIVDAHHHLWDLQACHYPWLMARGVKRFFGDPTPIQKNYLVEDLRADAVEYELAASVHVQVGVQDGDELRETEWLQRTADEQGLPSAIVAFCALERNEALATLEAHLRHSRVRGVRQIVGRSDDEDAVTGSGELLNSAAWRSSLAALPQLGLSFDLQLTPRQVPGMADALEFAPDTRVALCHCGSPWDQSTAGLKTWKDGLRLLASNPNVYCKVSGFGMFDHSWSIDSIRPIVEACVETFGAKRCMFGSNFPVDKLHADYAQIWSAFERIVGELDDADRRYLFEDTAREFYRIDAIE